MDIGSALLGELKDISSRLAKIEAVLDTQLVTVAEAAQLLRVSERTVWRIISRGDLLKAPGHKALIPRSEIREYTKRQ